MNICPIYSLNLARVFFVSLFHRSFFLLSGERGEKGERGNHAFINEIWPVSGKFWSIFIASTEGFPCSSIRQINLLIQTKFNKSIEEYIFWNDRKSFLDVLWSKRNEKRNFINQLRLNVLWVPAMYVGNVDWNWHLYLL